LNESKTGPFEMQGDLDTTIKLEVKKKGGILLEIVR